MPDPENHLPAIHRGMKNHGARVMNTTGKEESPEQQQNSHREMPRFFSGPRRIQHELSPEPNPAGRLRGQEFSLVGKLANPL